MASYVPEKWKRIGVIVFVALACLVACYVLYRRFCFKASKPLPMQGKFDEAAAKFKDALEVNPRSIFALERYAETLRQQGKFDEAAAKFKDALEVNPRSVFALERYAETLRQQGKFDEAAAKFKEASEIKPKSAFALASYAETLRQQGKFDEAAAKFKEASEIEPKSAFALRGYADTLRRQGKFDKAAAKFKEALEIDPTSVFALMCYADTLRQQGKFDEAAAKFKEALEIDPTSAFALMCYADTLRQQGKFDEAAAKFKEALEIDPKSAFALVYYAETLRQQGKFDEAAAKFKEALKIDPRSAFALERYAETLRLQGKLDEAAAKFKEALKIDPRSAFALVYYADTLRQQGKLDEAAEKFKEALEINPTSHIALRGYAETLRQQGKFDEAAAKFKEALKVNPRSVFALESYADTLRRQGKFDEVAAKFKEALEINPKSAFALERHADTLRRQGKFDEAAEKFKEALEIDPTSAFALKRYADTLHLQGKLDEAAEKFKEALEIDPTSHIALRGYAETLRQQGKFDEAAEKFKDILKVYPRSVFALERYADTLRQQDKLDEAVEKFKEALEIDPTSAFALGSYADTLRQQSKFDEAAEKFKEALEIDPKNAFALASYADTLRRQGKFDEAAEKFKDALEVNPKSTFAWDGYNNILLQQGKLLEEAVSARRQELLLAEAARRQAALLADVLLGRLERNEFLGMQNRLGPIPAKYIPKAAELERAMAGAEGIDDYSETNKTHWSSYAKSYNGLTTAADIFKIGFSCTLKEFFELANAEHPNIMLNRSVGTPDSPGVQAIYRYLAMNWVKNGKIVADCHGHQLHLNNKGVMMLPSLPKKVLEYKNEGGRQSQCIIIHFTQKDDFTPSEEILQHTSAASGIDPIAAKCILAQLAESELKHLSILLREPLIENHHPDYQDTLGFMSHLPQERAQLIHALFSLIDDIGVVLQTKFKNSIAAPLWEDYLDVEDFDLQPFRKTRGEEWNALEQLRQGNGQIDQLVDWVLDYNLFNDDRFADLIETSKQTYQNCFKILKPELLKAPQLNKALKIDSVTWNHLKHQYYLQHAYIPSQGCLFSNLLAILVDDPSEITESNIKKFKQTMAAYLDDPKHAEPFETPLRIEHGITLGQYKMWLKGEEGAPRIIVNHLTPLQIEIAAHTFGVRIALFTPPSGPNDFAQVSGQVDECGRLVPLDGVVGHYFGPRTKEILMMAVNNNFTYYGLFPILNLKLPEARRFVENNDQYNDLVKLENYWKSRAI